MNSPLSLNECFAHEPFVWICQSHYSFLHGCAHPNDLIEAANQYQSPGLCLADFDGVYGLARFYLSAKRLHAEEKLFYGTQVRIPLGDLSDLMSPPLCTPSDLIAPSFLQPRLVLIAQSHDGYRQICKLLRYTHREGKSALMLDLNDEHIPWPQSDVIALLPMRGWGSLCPPGTMRSQSWLHDLKNLHCLWQTKSQGKSPFFLALTPPSQPLEHAALKAHLWAHEQLSIPLLATEDIWMSKPEQKPLFDLLQAIRLNTPLEEIKDWACFPNCARSLAPGKKLRDFCLRNPRFIEAYRNNIQLAKTISFSFSELRYHYPREFVPEGKTPLEQLESLTWSAAHRRYQGHIPKRVCQLLDKELALVGELGFADYFLTVWDIVNFARSQGILCQGRGSAANSCVCFIIGITAVDPMVSDVLFERFISRERGEPPDIDVDFEHERREEVIQYIYNRYGRTRAAMVANVITFRRQGALRSTGKALGIPLADVDTLLRGTRDRFERDRSLFEIIRDRQKSSQIDISVDQLETWIAAARQLEGTPRHLGIHSGGFVISQDPLDALCPTEPATMEGRSVIQWCKDDLEGLGLFKIDVLALGMLSALRKTIEALSQAGHTIPNSKQDIRLDTIPADCATTYDMICKARTMGTFQIESRAQMSIIPRLQPRCFYDLVIQIGIIRPGPIVAGIVTRYVKRRTGQEATVYPDERLRPILERTLGVPVFQEQVMRIAMSVGDFSPGEADELRRSMGVWKLNGTIAQFEEKLRAGMQKNGIPDAFATEIYKQIEGFSEYGFPESHAISFAHLAYASAWLKAHFPAYFLLGLLNAQPLGFYSVHSLVGEARQAGVRILRPCLLFSNWDHSIDDPVKPLDNQYDMKQQELPHGIIRLGLRLVEGLSQNAVESFCQARKTWIDSTLVSRKGHLILWKGEHLQEHLEDFMRLMGNFFDSRSCLSLIMGGLLEGFSSDRRMMLWHFLGRPGVLRSDLELRSFRDVSPHTPHWKEDFDDLRDDFRTQGTSLSNHPLRAIKAWMWPYPIPVTSLTPSDRLSLLPPHRIVRVCGLVTIKQAPPTAKGMIFVTLEDETGTMNLTFTPQVAARFRKELTSGQSAMLCVEALIQGRDFGHSLRVKRVFTQEQPQKLADTIPIDSKANLSPQTLFDDPEHG